MRWKNFDEMSTDDGHKVYFSGEEDRHEYVVRFLVHRDLASVVLGCRPVSSRLINSPESSSFQYNHHTGLSINIWT